MATASDSDTYVSDISYEDGQSDTELKAGLSSNEQLADDEQTESQEGISELKQYTLHDLESEASSAEESSSSQASEQESDQHQCQSPSKQSSDHDDDDIDNIEEAAKQSTPDNEYIDGSAIVLELILCHALSQMESEASSDAESSSSQASDDDDDELKPITYIRPPPPISFECNVEDELAAAAATWHFSEEPNRSYDLDEIHTALMTRAFYNISICSTILSYL